MGRGSKGRAGRGRVAHRHGGIANRHQRGHKQGMPWGEAQPSPREEIPTGFASITMTGQDPCCGCPGVHGQGQTVLERVPPASVSDVYTPEEWQSLIRKIDAAFDTNQCPPCPTLCCFMLLWPLLVNLICVNNRQTALQQIAAAESQRLNDQGLEWIYTPGRRPKVLALRWIPGTRESFEARNPHRRPISREALTPEFLPAQQLLQIQMAQIMVAQGAVLGPPSGQAGVQMQPMGGSAAAGVASPSQQQHFYPGLPGGYAHQGPPPQQVMMDQPMQPESAWQPQPAVEQPVWNPPTQQTGSAPPAAASSAPPPQQTMDNNSSRVAPAFCVACGSSQTDPHAKQCARCWRPLP